MKFARLVRTRALYSLIVTVGCAGDSKMDDAGQQITAAGAGSSAAGSSVAGASGSAAIGGSSTTTTGSSGRAAANGGVSGGAGTTNGVSGASGGAGATAGRGAAGAAGATTAAGAGASGEAGASAGAGGSTAGGGGGANNAAAAGSGGSTTGSASPMMNFFVSSTTSMTANLNGLSGADERCQSLAATVGAGGKTWRAYLSAENPATNAIDRIGPGPYYNAQGMMLAADKAALHARAGDAALFLTETGEKVNGQWIDSPKPNEHDVLTGTRRDGTLAAGMTCADWTATTGMSQVGHSDGLGPNQATSGMYSYWNSVHTGQCGNTAPGGGAGRIYCFVSP